MSDTLPEGPTLTVDDVLTLRFLGLELLAEGGEVYEIAFRAAASEGWERGRLQHLGESSWELVDAQRAPRGTPSLGLPDDVFAVALGRPPVTAATVAQALPHWPPALQERLACRQASGACAIAFDGAWFLEQLTGTPIDRPLLFPDATRQLGLAALGQASAALVAAQGDGHGLVEQLRRALAAAEGSSAWRGEGRLIGESTWGDLVQVGSDLHEGCEAVVGRGPLRVAFDPDAPIGLGFGPQVPSADVVAGRPPAPGASVGTGLEVGEVDPGSAAQQAGVSATMVVTQVGPLAWRTDELAAPFEDLLEAIDECRDAGEWLEMVFATAAPLTHWYAVEMPAASALTALGAPVPDDAGVGASLDGLCGGRLLWREPIPRLFLGDPGSVTCAHVDICPQVQLAHGLVGTKVLGVASHTATPRLQVEHGGVSDDDGIDEGATHVPTDRPLSARQADLLGDESMSLVLLRPGGLAVLHSGALHFASNGAEGLGGSLYHGVITPGALPRLRASASAPGGAAPRGDHAYAGHLHAADLLERVEHRLQSLLGE